MSFERDIQLVQTKDALHRYIDKLQDGDFAVLITVSGQDEHRQSSVNGFQASD